MAFGIKKEELAEWKKKVRKGEIAFLTHYWYDERFPDYHSVTKVGCSNIKHLIEWGNKNGLKMEWIHHHKDFPHFDLLGEKQVEILQKYQLTDHLRKFKLLKK
ncbi:hypothetical protein ACTHHL_18065 [Aeribacillus composti]|uniref:hypothetical protein n=1 Tax=Aeribacillus composti TaxID=1868734 RepID=UPI00406A2495